MTEGKIKRMSKNKQKKRKSLASSSSDRINVPIASMSFPPDWLQIHAVDEVIRLLCCEWAGFLELVLDEPQAAADHQQQQSGDDDAQSQREDGPCERKQRRCQTDAA